MQRPNEQPKRKVQPSMRPPLRPASRAHSATPVPNGRASPATSTVSQGVKPRSPNGSSALKRKEREYEMEQVEDTNINVVVRCRGRNDREVRENSGVVVSTDGAKGKSVQLSMGPNALSNKEYHFDRVFSPAADQSMIFGEVVAPILDEVMSGFNCTIFAYGQTGTGKTYTMSGDITDRLPLPDDSGIIPRALHSLFQRLENGNHEYSVKCSFIELYNEELRDLIAADDNLKLKLYDDASRKSHGATLVQGIEETYIKSASKGLDLLRIGSHKRQVAATKCNDLSSRSHTVFTITAFIKRPNENGEDFVSTGKLNLVDLAGSENIQRSGAENKRAAEAGLINKSLLTLGRVINALVDKSSHIPYRESKLTRLLQDSLGGRTKTCIIATLSPAKSNLEETISTLDYAFRAKNIRNKPQMNQTMSKKTLFREFTYEIEKLKSELIAARHRNGVYLTPETYEEMTTESESRRILTEEQRDKIEGMEAKLKSKAEELFTLTSDLSDVKKSHEAVGEALKTTKNVLEETDLVLSHTQQSLREEEMLRRAHQDTESKLQQTGQDLLDVVGRQTTDIEGLSKKLRRRSDLHRTNRAQWEASQNEVTSMTQSWEKRLSAFEDHQRFMLDSVSSRVQDFVKSQLESLDDTQAVRDELLSNLAATEQHSLEESSRAHDEMSGVIAEVQSLRTNVKDKFNHGLQGLTEAAQKISAGVMSELEAMHSAMHTSYSTFGKELKVAFDGLTDQIKVQSAHISDLETRLTMANENLSTANESAIEKFERAIESEKQQHVDERRSVIDQISTLLNGLGEASDRRLDQVAASVKLDMRNNCDAHSREHKTAMESVSRYWPETKSLEDNISKAREAAKLRLKQDWTAADERNLSIQTTAKCIHEQTESLVGSQMGSMEQQLSSFDEILGRLNTGNERHHHEQTASLTRFAETARSSVMQMDERMQASTVSHHDFDEAMTDELGETIACLAPLQADFAVPMASLRRAMTEAKMSEYTVTGQTPQKLTYSYPTTLPATRDHQSLLKELRGDGLDVTPEEDEESVKSLDISDDEQPTKTQIYTDTDEAKEAALKRSTSRPTTSSSNGGLREIDANVQTLMPTVVISEMQDKAFRSSTRTSKRVNKAGVQNGNEMSKPARGLVNLAEGRENQLLSASMSSNSGRNLRSRNS